MLDGLEIQKSFLSPIAATLKTWLRYICEMRQFGLLVVKLGTINSAGFSLCILAPLLLTKHICKGTHRYPQVKCLHTDQTFQSHLEHGSICLQSSMKIQWQYLAISPSKNIPWRSSYLNRMAWFSLKVLSLFSNFIVMLLAKQLLVVRNFEEVWKDF